MPGTDAVLRAADLSRTYGAGPAAVHALQEVSLTVAGGQLTVLRGRSGSGKTTLLNLLGGLDRPTAGQIWFRGCNLGGLPERALTALRLRHIGFVFQSFALLPLLSARENVELPLRLAGLGARARRERAAEWLAYVGLSQRSQHRPFELSGGEQQRVALARALAPGPAVILADEPTGELDTRNAAQMVALLRRTARETGVAICMTSHDPTISEVADVVYTLADGRLQQESEAVSP